MHKQAAPVESVATVDERFEKLPIDAIIRSATNPRTHFNDDYIQELAGSIAEKGLIQPIIVRPHPQSSGFEIVAGECRWRASKVAGLERVPSIIRHYTDEEVLDAQLIENIHRTDLTPLEQAVGYRRLIDANPTKYSAETIAARVGMSPAWVWDRLKLNDLIPEAKTILEEERITVGHAILLARLKPADQARAVKVDRSSGGYEPREALWRADHGFNFDAADPKNADRKRGPYDGVKACSVRELERWIQNHVRFDVAHAAKALPLKFEETAAVVDAASAKPGRGNKVIAITHEYRVADDARDEGERTYGSQSWVRADGQEKSKTCEYSVLGIVVAGEGQGSTLQVCVARDKCLVHFGTVIRQKEKNAKLRESGQGKKAAKNEKRAENQYELQRRREEEARKVWEAERPALLKAFAEHVKTQKVTPELVGLVIDSYHRTDATKVAGPITDKNLGQVMAVSVVLRHGTWNRSQFAAAVKPFKFTLPKAPAAGQSTTKKTGKKR